MKLEQKDNCPLNSFNPCKKLDCAWFIRIRGKNPNTGEEVDDYGCSMSWMPVLMIENSQQQRSTGAAVESFRNEMVKSNKTSQQVLLASVQKNNPEIKVIEVDK